MLRLLIPFLLSGPAFAIPASTTLQLVQGDPGFNELTVTVDPDTPIPLPDTDIANLTGSVVADFNINLTTGTTSELTLRNGRADSSELNFSNSFIVGYNVTAQNLSASVATTSPPGTVDELTGDFSASQHGFVIDQGTISGTALGNPVNITLSPTSPFEGTGSGTGNVTLTPAGISGIYQQFSVVVTLPVTISDNFDASGTNVALDGTGTLKAAGNLDVPRSEYLAWTVAEGIPGADGQADANWDGVPNAIAWALGLGAFDPAGDYVLRTANGGYEIQFPPAGSAAPITVQGSDLSSPWTPISSTRIPSSPNPLPPGSIGVVTISRAPDEFLRLFVDE